MKSVSAAVTAVLVFVLAGAALASEECGMLGGTCRDVCRTIETAENGVFEDCKQQEDCCVPRSDDAVRCCVRSFDRQRFGPGNCMPPGPDGCTEGSGSPASCDRLAMCRN